MPTIVIAHTFCASRDTRISYRRRLLMQGYVCVVQNYAEKAELSKCSWYPKRKLGVTMHFSEIIKLQLGKERHTLLCILKHFTNIVDYYLRKMRGYPQFSFWILITLLKICFSRIFSKPRKNTFELVGTVLKDGAYYCHCAYVLRISRYSDFLLLVLINTGIFLRGSKLCGESRT